MIKAIIFDVGGVLVRTEDRTPRTELAKSFGKTYHELDEIVFGGESGRAAQLGRKTAEAHWHTVAELLDLESDSIAAFQAQFFGGDILDRTLVNIIRELKNSYTTCVLSNMMDNLRHLLTNEWKIADAFHALVISAEAGVMKPDPQIYQMALAACRVAPSEAVFIDDFEHNIEGAKSAGMQGIWFRNRDQTLADLNKFLKI